MWRYEIFHSSIFTSARLLHQSLNAYNISHVCANIQLLSGVFLRCLHFFAGAATVSSYTHTISLLCRQPISLSSAHAALPQYGPKNFHALRKFCQIYGWKTIKIILNGALADYHSQKSRECVRFWGNYGFRVISFSLGFCFSNLILTFTRYMVPTVCTVVCL